MRPTLRAGGQEVHEPHHPPTLPSHLSTPGFLPSVREQTQGVYLYPSLQASRPRPVPMGASPSASLQCQMKGKGLPTRRLCGPPAVVPSPLASAEPLLPSYPALAHQPGLLAWEHGGGTPRPHHQGPVGGTATTERAGAGAENRWHHGGAWRD